MDTLRNVLAAACLVVAAPADAETVADWRPYIAEASIRSAFRQRGSRP